MRAFIDTDPAITGITQPINEPIVPPCGNDMFPPPASRAGDDLRLSRGGGKRRLPRAVADLDGKTFPHTNAYGEEVAEEVPAFRVPTVVGLPADSGSVDWLFWGAASLYALLLVKAVRMLSGSLNKRQQTR